MFAIDEARTISIAAAGHTHRSSCGTPMSTRFVRTLEALMLVGALATIPLTVLGEENQQVVWVQTADWAIGALFLLEHMVMDAIGSDRILYIRQNPLNLPVIDVCGGEEC